jgi:hypothetical protein
VPFKKEADPVRERPGLQSSRKGFGSRDIVNRGEVELGVYLVTWKLKTERADYEAVRDAFVERLHKYWYIHDEEFESVYFIETPLPAGQVNADLHQGLDPDDKIVVAQVLDGTYCGWLPQPVWDWIEERL